MANRSAQTPYPGKHYLTGPMSGIPQFNVPAFEAAARVLRDMGWDVVHPVELDAPGVREELLRSKDGAQIPDRHGGTWGDLLARDVKLVADGVTGLILLDGWAGSRGARLEIFVGLLCKRHFFRYYEKTQSISYIPFSTMQAQFVGSVYGIKGLTQDRRDSA